ncbi:MAG TPA: ATP-binding cassette domain-containing protein, partial [Bacilli bacterium]|nr:ATP-binding cassette domain-containing protein [Bacilli bacterium]
MSILEVRDLNFSYGDQALYNNLNLKVEMGEHIGFLGANGTGKSTLLKLLAHKLIPDSGEIIWQDHVTFSYLDQF